MVKQQKRLWTVSVRIFINFSLIYVTWPFNKIAKQKGGGQLLF